MIKMIATDIDGTIFEWGKGFSPAVKACMKKLKDAGVKIFSSGAMEMDLTQTSFSTVPSIDIELGDKASDHSDAALEVLAQGLVDGVNRYFGK